MSGDNEIIERVSPYTMTSRERLTTLVDAIRYLCRNRIPGDIVECGVWKGGSVMAAALALQQEKDDSRCLYLYDTFQGMSQPTDSDETHDGQSAKNLLATCQEKMGAWCYCELDEVCANVASTGYPQERVNFVKGRVEDTIPSVMPEAISLLRLDTDWYESTNHELIHLYPRLVPNGALIIDDYGDWKGARKATDEYFSSLSFSPFLHRIDATGRLVIKPR